MLVKNFREDCGLYQNFMVWDIENMAAFLGGNPVIAEVFKNDYKMGAEEFEERRAEITLSNMEIMESVLDQIGDKHFLIFTYHSDNHSELVQMQTQKVMDFGLDIEDIAKDHVFVLIMDKKNTFTMN